MACFKVRVLFFAVILCVNIYIVSTQDYSETEFKSGRKLVKLGEFNDECKTLRDCRTFGYVCRDNKTCQCDYLYVPDVHKRTCVGGVNQKCIYDEHCIEGAFCMNQELCKCKETSPVEFDDGLVCAGCNDLQFDHLFAFILLILYFYTAGH